MGLIENKRLAVFTSASVSSSSRGRSWWRWRWWRHVVRGRCRSGVHEELPVEEAEHNDPDDSRDDHHLQVLQPELVLHGRSLLLELGGAILEGVSSLLEGAKLVITVEPENQFSQNSVRNRSVLKDNFVHLLNFHSKKNHRSHLQQLLAQRKFSLSGLKDA